MKFHAEFVIALILILASLSMVLAIPGIRARLVGSSNTRIALIPVVTAGLIWLAAFSSDILKGRLEESSIPADILAIHIQSVDFGLPTIPLTYRTQIVSDEQFRAAVSPLMDSNFSINLNPEELKNLNRIASVSGMLEEFTENRTYTTRDIARMIHGPIYFTYNYSNWADTTKEWSRFLDENSNRTAPTMNELLERFRAKQTFAGIAQSIIGMAHRADLKIERQPHDCEDASINAVEVKEGDEGMSYLEFRTYRALAANKSRTKFAEEFAQLINFSCVDSLAILFEKAASDFSREHSLMIEYIDAINKVISARAPKSIRISASISNNGRFDSFVRSSAKVSVGHPKGSEPLSFTVALAAPIEGEDNSDTLKESDSARFIHVTSRSNLAVRYIAELTEEDQKRLYGAYQAELAQIRIGTLASTGSSESPVYSQSAPFSVKARLEYEQKIGGLVVPIE